MIFKRFIRMGNWLRQKGIGTNSIMYRDDVPMLFLYEATDWLSRLKGLFAFPRLCASRALLIKPCSAVHTIGMNYSIDVVFLDHFGVVIKIRELAPGSLSVCWKAQYVVEMLAGTVERLNICVDQRMHFKKLIAGNYRADFDVVTSPIFDRPGATELDNQRNLIR